MEIEFYFEKFANNLNFFHIAELEDPNKLEISHNNSMDSNDWKQMLRFKER